MGNLWEIRTAREGDLGQAAAIAAESFARPWSVQGFRDALSMKSSCFLVAVAGREVLGYCLLSVAADEGEVVNIAVKPECRGGGLGDALLKAALRLGESRGVSRFFLEVRVSNEPAIRLYEQNGFRRKGIRKGFYGETGEDAYMMNRLG